MGTHATSIDLPTAVIRATTPIAGSTDERVEGDSVGMMELTEYVRLNQSCLPDLCKHLKARLKDADQMVSRISLDVIDTCQQTFGFQFQTLVMKNMLKRILIMSEPKSGLSYKLREVACKYLLLWGERYGIDPRLKKFKDAGIEIRKRAAKDEAKEMKAMAEAARIAKQADMEELKSQLMSQGKSPGRTGSLGRLSSGGSIPSPSTSSSASNLFSASFGKNSGRNLLNAAKGPQMATVASATFNGLKPMVEEHLGMLSALMDGSSPEEVANNYEAEKSARSCTILRNKLEAISEHLSSTNKHTELVECLGITEELSKRLQQYERIRIHFGAGQQGSAGRMTRSSSRASSNMETSSSYSAADTDRSHVGLVQGIIFEQVSTSAGSTAGAAGEPSAPSLPMPAAALAVPKANQIQLKEVKANVKENQIVPKFGSAPVFHSPQFSPQFQSPQPGQSAHDLQTPPWSNDQSGAESPAEEDAEGPDTDFLKAQLDPALRAQLGLDDGVESAAKMTAMMGVSDPPSPFTAASGLPTRTSPETLSPSQLGAQLGAVSPSTSSIAAAAAGVDPAAAGGDPWQSRERSNSVKDGARLVMPSQMRKGNKASNWGECVLTCDSIRHPVRASDGHVYEKWAIEKWLKENNNRSPLTNIEISPHLTILTEHDLPGMLQERHSCPTFSGSHPTI